MSRTYRTKRLYYKKVHGEYYTFACKEFLPGKNDEDLDELKEKLGTEDMARRGQGSCPFKWASFVYKKCRDKKAWNKPPKWFKQMHRQQERAKTKESLLRLGNDPDSDNVIPNFPKGDQWDWT